MDGRGSIDGINASLPKVPVAPINNHVSDFTNSGPAPRRFFDIAHPGKTAAPASAKPIIVSNKPLARDPMLQNANAESKFHAEDTFNNFNNDQSPAVHNQSRSTNHQASQAQSLHQPMQVSLRQYSIALSSHRILDDHSIYEEQPAGPGQEPVVIHNHPVAADIAPTVLPGMAAHPALTAAPSQSISSAQPTPEQASVDSASTSPTSPTPSATPANIIGEQQSGQHTLQPSDNLIVHIKNQAKSRVWVWLLLVPALILCVGVAYFALNQLVK